MLKINFPVKKEFSNETEIVFDKPILTKNKKEIFDVLRLRRKFLYNIIGLNGVGKTTFLNIISLLTGFEGKYFCDSHEESIYVNSHDNLINKDNTRLNRFSYIFQDPHILNMYTVEENLRLVNREFDFNTHFERLLSKIEKEICEEYKEYLIIKLKYLQEQKDRSPYYLSGGEKQLLSFIRAMINPSNAIFADEPWASMDQKLKNFVEQELYLYLTNNDTFAEFRQKKKFSKNNIVVIITHKHHHYNNRFGSLDKEWTRNIPVINKKNKIKRKSNKLIIERYKPNIQEIKKVH